jgi:hypothetical protein
MGSLAQFIGIALGYMLFTLTRELWRRRFWREVAEDAKKDLANPAIPVDDPVTATELALAKKQRKQIAAVARTITDSQRVAVTRTPSTNLVDRPFDKRTRVRTPDTHPRGHLIVTKKDDDV